ncbi:helix-turn-helix transcriptional regulator [Actinoallomurus sp. NPDC052274]|uniref:helix-turn-helix domain-containing protein n=1 Tax=Actinoallomurus sp. NPDC052274 TaxID=3155420 RepID=UPI003431E204
MLSHTVSGQEVRSLREARGKSVRQLAEEAGISADYLYKIERGAKNPSATATGRLAQALGVQPKKLLARPAAAEPSQ